MHRPDTCRRRPVAAWHATRAPDHPPGGHEEATLDALARRIARLRGSEYLGAFDASALPPRNAYLVPGATLLCAQVRELDVHAPADLFGGVVPHGFVATKLVSHPSVHADAPVPLGWDHALARRLAQAVLPGFSLFRAEAAMTAFDRLVPLGPVRFKLARGIGGNGQQRITTRAELADALAALPEGELERHGASLEQDLRDAVTYSIGIAECAGQRIAYHGEQHTVTSPQGHEVYAGSTLDVVRGGLDDLLAGLASAPIDRPGHSSLLRAVRQARRYDIEMQRAFPGFFASRRNYDVVAGLDARGTHRSGVLEQSWRIGGASPAELLAMEAFAANPAVVRVRVSCHEAYGDCTPPAGATVHYNGDDPRLGPLTKYAVLLAVDERAHGHAA
ncbi:MAG TPA: DUF3182 family protein [Xanthomonadaceae bacterium]|nr:DUF3182 family protein [Xanthomonadaceae bacterium]